MKTLKKMITVSVFIVAFIGFVSMVQGSAYGFPGAGKVLTGTPAASGKININTAGVQELVKLPRVGEKTAQRIIEYREKHGKFKRIEDIMKVKGIGEKTFKKFENMISVGKTKKSTKK